MHPLIERLHEHRSAKPGSVAIAFLDRRGLVSDEITYAELHDRVNEAASAFRALDASTVFIELEQGPNLIVMFLGALAAGIRPSIIEPPRSSPIARLREQRVLDAARPDVVISEDPTQGSSPIEHLSQTIF